MSTSMPSSSPAIWRIAMRSPWPRSTLPQNKVTVPSPSTAKKESSSLASSMRGTAAAPAARFREANAKLTVSAPVPARTARRVGRCDARCAISASLSRGQHHGPHDPHMRSAAAEIAFERGADVILSWLRLFRKQRGRTDDHPTGAVAALAETTTEFRGGEPKAAQRVEQRLNGIGRFDRALDPVDTKPVGGHETLLPGETITNRRCGRNRALQKSECGGTATAAN